ncbi:hypothetical protein AVEN_177753-1 [Araneus ventricosus]|uniref:Uncharacterized protein n=1 Tax=Araneus ventricosus TaxID=182803 RepID=A0A4Y2I7V3_ARAVE|nr:hypothetical protein AVEN_177753-1 [Araneus ventricosus]
MSAVISINKIAIKYVANTELKGCGYLVLRFRLRDQRVPGSRSDSPEDPPCMGMLHVKSYLVAKGPLNGVMRKVEEGAPA